MADEKACSKCQRVKPLTEFDANRKTPDGLQYTCRSCQVEYQRERQAAIRAKHAAGELTTPERATCQKCGVEKPIADFSKNRGTESGHFAWCRECVRAHDKARRAAPKVVQAEATCVRCGRTKPASDFTRSAYRPNGLCASCKECSRAYVRAAYHASDKVARCKQTREWVLKNRRKVVAYAIRSNAKRRAVASVPYTQQEWDDRLAEFGHRCAYCRRHESECGQLAIEHMSPLSRGGIDEICNVVPACKRCNSKKHASSLLEFCFGRDLFKRRVSCGPTT